MRSDDVSHAVSDKDLDKSVYKPLNTNIARTMAFTVVFFVKPPTFPVDIASVSGKLQENAFARQ